MKTTLRRTIPGLMAAGLLASLVAPLTSLAAASAQAAGDWVRLSSCADSQPVCTTVVIRIEDTSSTYGQTPTPQLNIAQTDADPSSIPTVITVLTTLSSVDVVGLPSGDEIGRYPLSLRTDGLPSNLDVYYLAGAAHTVTRAPLKISANGTFPYGTTPKPTFSGLVNGDTPADVKGVELVGVPDRADVGAYSADIELSEASPHYAIVTEPGVINVTTARVVIDPTNTVVYGDPTAGFRGTVSGLAPWHTRDDVYTQILGTSAPAGAGVGVYPVKVSGLIIVNRDHYIESVVRGIQTIVPRPVTVQVHDQTWVQGTPMPELTATWTGLAAGQAAPADLSLSTTAPADAAPGKYLITAKVINPDANFTIGVRRAGILTVLPSA